MSNRDRIEICCRMVSCRAGVVARGTGKRERVLFLIIITPGRFSARWGGLRRSGRHLSFSGVLVPEDLSQQRKRGRNERDQ